MDLATVEHARSCRLFLKLLPLFSPQTYTTKMAGTCPRRHIGGLQAYAQVSKNVFYLSFFCLQVAPPAVSNSMLHEPFWHIWHN